MNQTTKEQIAILLQGQAQAVQTVKEIKNRMDDLEKNPMIKEYLHLVVQNEKYLTYISDNQKECQKVVQAACTHPVIALTGKTYFENEGRSDYQYHCLECSNPYMDPTCRGSYYKNIDDPNFHCSTIIELGSEKNLWKAFLSAQKQYATLNEKYEETIVIMLMDILYNCGGEKEFMIAKNTIDSGKQLNKLKIY